jgi:hypothetical protein
LIRSGHWSIWCFANEHELKALYQTADFDTALAALKARRGGGVTRSEKGALASSPGGDRQPCPPIRSTSSLIRPARAICLPPAISSVTPPVAPLHRWLGALAASHVIQTHRRPSRRWN